MKYENPLLHKVTWGLNQGRTVKRVQVPETTSSFDSLPKVASEKWNLGSQGIPSQVCTQPHVHKFEKSPLCSFSLLSIPLGQDG